MNQKNHIKIHFDIRKKKKKDSKSSICARIFINGKQIQLPTFREIDPEKWDSKNEIAIGKDKQTKLLNNYLLQFREDIIGRFNNLRHSQIHIDVDMLKIALNGSGEIEYTLMNLFDYHNNEMDYQLEWGTLKNYFTTKKYFELYIKKTFQIDDIFLNQLHYPFLIGFEKYMYENTSQIPNKPCGQNTIMKHIERFRKVINLAVKNEWLKRDPFLKFKATYIRKEREYLTSKELQSIESVSLTNNEECVKDLFVFSCYTGLSYADVYNLSENHIVRGYDDELWINTKRKKTNQPLRIPILPKAMDIINKYKCNEICISKKKLLPSYSNHSINDYLKNIASICDIKKPLTFHIARHTFATTITLTNDVPIETVSKLLGHTSIKTTQIYAKVIETKIGNDMQKLKDKLNNIKKVRKNN